jgi:hypothetical protein
VKASLWDEKWRSFILATEENTAFAATDWRRFRAGVRRLEAMYRGTVPQAAMEMVLAEDVFVCAAHWKRSPRIVRAALRNLLSRSLGPKLFANVAVEYWKWAATTSPADVSDAEAMVERARAQLYKLSRPERENVERLYAIARRDAGLG